MSIYDCFMFLNKHIMLHPVAYQSVVGFIYLLLLYIMATKQYNRIKAALAEKKITNKKLASLLGVEPQTVSRWCTNQSQPSIETLYQISKALKMDIRELLVPTNWR